MGVATQLLASSDGSWLKTTCMSALSSLVRLQARFSTRLAFLFPDLLKLLENCISQGMWSCLSFLHPPLLFPCGFPCPLTFRSLHTYPFVAS